MLFFFLVSVVTKSIVYYLIIVIVFMPVTCLCGIYVKERCKRVYLSQLMNDSMNTEEETLLCFLHLGSLYTDESEDAWQQLI